MNIKKSTIICFITGFLGSVFRMGLMLSTPAYIIGNAGLDDAGQVGQAAAMCARNWLGDYNYTTLTKGAVFPFFVSLARLLCMPYYMLLALFYFLAAIVFVVAVRKEIVNKWLRLIIYLFLIYNPVGFSGDVTQRLYRNALCYPAVLLLVSCLIGLYIGLERSKKEYALWLTGTGLSLSFFYYIREDSIWMLPMTGAVIVLSALKILFKNTKSDSGNTDIDNNTSKYLISKKRVFFLICPIIIFICITGCYMLINHHFYGVYTINDRTGGAFGKLTEKLLLIEDGCMDDTRIWLSRETLKKAIEVSPTLKDKDGDIPIEYYNLWSNDKGTPGDLYVWALRCCFSDIGYCSNAAELEDYCKKINEELDQAFKDGRLKKRDAIFLSGHAKGRNSEELGKLFKSAFSNLMDVSLYRRVTGSGLIPAAGSDAEIRFMESMTLAHGIRQNDENGTEDKLLTISIYICNINNGFIKLYGYITPFVMIIALILYLVIVINYILKRSWENFDKVIIPLGMVLSAYILEVGVSMMTDWIGPAGLWFYSSGVLPLSSIFQILCIYWGVKCVKSRISKKADA
jgi:hypothetical protein